MTAPGKLSEGLTERVVKLLEFETFSYRATALTTSGWQVGCVRPPSWSPTCLPLRWA